MAVRKKKTSKSKTSDLKKSDSSKDKWIKCISIGGNIHATAIQGTNLVSLAASQHKYGALESLALGESLLGSLLMASTCKEGERVSIVVRGNGLLRQAVADADPSGVARGFVVAGEGVLDDDSAPWQDGTLTVVRQKQHEKEPYTGTVPCLTGYFAKDLTYYLSQSEQIPSAVGIAVNIEQTGEVLSAGAFLVQIMAGATDEEVKEVEKNIQKMKTFAAQIADLVDPSALLGQIFSPMTFTIVENKELDLFCNCSKNRVKNAMYMVGEQELKEMINVDHGAKVRCDFCGKEYVLSIGELEQVMKDIKKQ
ncbi:MAG: Hsp33 family molecular chaperone HslO [Bacteriovoracia bacterium]